MQTSTIKVWHLEKVYPCSGGIVHGVFMTLTTAIQAAKDSDPSEGATMEFMPSSWEGTTYGVSRECHIARGQMTWVIYECDLQP